MNKGNIIEWIDHPERVDENATRALREIIQEFPASPILHWLYLKGLQNQKSYLFNSALSRAAIGSPNRAQLLKWVGVEQNNEEVDKKKRFEFVAPESAPQKSRVEKAAEIKSADTTPKPEAVPESTPKVEMSSTEPKAPEKKPIARPAAKKKEPADLPDDIKAILERSKKIRSGFKDVSHKEKEEPAATPKEQVEEVSETLSEESTPAKVPAPQVHEIPKEVEEEPEALSEINFAEFEASTEVNSEFTEEGEMQEEETYFSLDLDIGLEDLEDTVLTQEEETEKVFSIELEDYEEEDIQATSFTESKTASFSKSDGQDNDFTGWLKSLRSEPEQTRAQETEAKPVIEEPVKPQVEDKKEEISFELNTDVIPPKPEEPAPEKSKNIELIDRFLEERPKITPRKEDFSYVNIGESVKDDENQLVTETLAKIYVAQGHYNKAIEAYEILGLKYPEKNGLFADRIREIKRRK